MPSEISLASRQARAAARGWPRRLGLVAYGLQRAGYGRAVEVLGTVSLVAFVVYQLYERIWSYKGPHGWE